MKIKHFKPKQEKRGLIYQVFVILGIIQVALMLSVGSYVVTRTVLEEETKFTPPKASEKQEPPKRAHNANVQRQNKKSTKKTKRIAVKNVGNVKTQEVKIALPASISMGGGGITTISEKTLKADIKIAVPSIELMGLKSRAEKILICVDASSYLMNEERGGLETYKVIREDIKKLVNGLPSTSLFNIMAFDATQGTRVNLFQSNLVAATAFNKKLACNWIEPINSSLKRIGPGRHNYKPKYEFLPQPPDSAHYRQSRSNIYRIYQAAMEQGAEAIWILTTRWEDPDKIMRPWSDAEIERYRKATERYDNDVERARKRAGWNDDKQAEYEQLMAQARQKGIKKAREWITAENARRKAKGQSLYTGTPTQAMHENKFLEKLPADKCPPAVKIKKPDIPKFRAYGFNGIAKHYTQLFKEVYLDKQMGIPVVNMIVFRGKNEDMSKADAKVIRDFISKHKGRMRVLKGLEPVKD